MVKKGVRPSGKKSRPAGKKSLVTQSDSTKLVKLVSQLVSRREFATRAGMSFDGERDLYAVLGYKRDVTFDDYLAMYQRGDIAARIVDARPEATWRRRPTISNDTNPDEFSEFETAWVSLERKRRIFHYLERADKLAGIGQYGCLLIGTADVRSPDDLQRPMARLKGPDSVLYLTPYTEESAKIDAIDTDPRSERFGLPSMYRVTISASEDAGTTLNPSNQMLVHWSRIIHVAEGLQENDIYGTPRLQSVYNRLYDVDKIAGGSAEIFWQAAKRIMVLTAKDGVTGVDDNDTFTEQMEELIHGLRRVIDVQGYEVKTLDPTDVKPEEAFRVTLALVSSATGIPQRILLGSEQGKMASTQDEVNWNGKIADRQLNFAEPVMLRPLIDRLVAARALPDPGGEYIITWPSLFELSDKEKAQIGLLKARALAQYAGKMGENVESFKTIIPVQEFRSEFLNLRGRKIENANVKGGGQADAPNDPDTPAKPAPAETAAAAEE